MRVSGLQRLELQRCFWEVERVKCRVTKGLCARESASRSEGKGEVTAVYRKGVWGMKLKQAPEWED